MIHNILINILCSRINDYLNKYIKIQKNVHRRSILLYVSSLFYDNNIHLIKKLQK